MAKGTPRLAAVVCGMAAIASLLAGHAGRDDKVLELANMQRKRRVVTHL